MRRIMLRNPSCYELADGLTLALSLRRPAAWPRCVQRPAGLALLLCLYCGDLSAQTADDEPSAAVGPETPAPSPAPSSATGTQDTVDARAQRHWESGMAYLDEGEYGKALEAFTKAYELSERPAILRSIAVAHEKLGDLASAITTIDTYLRQMPNAANLHEVHVYRAKLEALAEDEQRAMDESQKADEKHRPEVVTHTVQAKPYALPHTQEFAPATAPQPAGDDVSTRTVVQWSALGVGVVAGLGAGLTGVLAQRQYDDLEETCDSKCNREDTHNARTLAIGSSVLTAVAIISVGVGVWLWWDPTADETASTSPRPKLDAEYDNGRLISYAQWRF